MNALEDARAALAWVTDAPFGDQELVYVAKGHITRLLDLTAPPTDDEREALVNYCPEHGDLLNRPGDGADCRSYRCREAHHIDEIRAGFRRQGPITDTLLNDIALTLLGPSAFYDRDQLRAVLENGRAT